MKVVDLINKLKSCNPESTVIISLEDSGDEMAPADTSLFEVINQPEFGYTSLRVENKDMWEGI